MHSRGNTYYFWLPAVDNYPSPAPEQPAASGGSFYYQHDVWIGVVEPNELAQAVFFAPGPTLIVHPTGDGWSGYLHFIIGSQSASASGHLVMLLPLTAKIGKSRSSFVSVSVQSATSESLYSTSSALQYVVDPGGGGSLAGLGLFRAVSVTIENSDDSFYMQLASNVFFVAIGFLLSEVAVLAEKRKKDRRAAAESN
jgi:hypothetical protein